MISNSINKVAKYKIAYYKMSDTKANKSLWRVSPKTYMADHLEKTNV